MYFAKWTTKNAASNELKTALPANMFMVAGRQHKELGIFTTEQAS